MATPAVDITERAETSPNRFVPKEVEQFHRDGYLISRGLADETLRHRMLAVTLDGLRREIGPIEYEADLHYRGAPLSRESDGGSTIRRLKQAHARDIVFTEWVSRPVIADRLRQLLGSEIIMPLAHHNCIMTKQPRYSSETGWHQDIRYWSFQRPELISVWLALDSEHPKNGCLRLIPGTHLTDLQPHRLDADLFLRPELLENQQLIDTEVDAALAPGDVLFFHCRTFHVASRNYTDAPKFSVVFTFRRADNHPIPNTRSASVPELLIPTIAQ